MVAQLYDRPMRFYTEYLTFKTASHRDYINITPQVEGALRKSGIQEGMILVPPCTLPRVYGSTTPKTA